MKPGPMKPGAQPGGALVTIRPALPDLSATPVVPDPIEAIRRAYLRLDPGSGELVWCSDRQRPREERLPLGPGRGGVTELVVARYGSINRLTDVARLLLVNGEGRVLASSRLWIWPVFEQVWSEQVLAPARSAGLEVVSRRFRSPRLVQKAYPGGAKRWYLNSQPWLFLVTASTLVGLVALVLVLLTVLGVLR